MWSLFNFCSRMKGETNMIRKIDYTSGARRDKEGYPVYYDTKNPLFVDLPQYHFNRDDMCDIFDADFMTWFWDHLEDRNDEFIITHADDEYYIIHLTSGTIVNWYKHVGRTNTCNKDLTLDDLREFKKMLLESFGYEEVK